MRVLASGPTASGAAIMISGSAGGGQGSFHRLHGLLANPARRTLSNARKAASSCEDPTRCRDDSMYEARPLPRSPLADSGIRPLSRVRSPGITDDNTWRNFRNGPEPMV